MQQKIILAFGLVMTVGLCAVGGIALGGVMVLVTQTTAVTPTRLAIILPTVTYTPTPRPSPTATPTPLLPTPTPTLTFTPTPSPTSTATETVTPTPTEIPTETATALPTVTPLPTATLTPEPTATPHYAFFVKENSDFPTNHPDFDIYIAITDGDNKPLGGYHVMGTHSSGLQVDSAVSAGDWTENSGAMWYKGANLKYHVANAAEGSWTMQLLDGANQPVAEPVNLNFEVHNLKWYFLLYRQSN